MAKNTETKKENGKIKKTKKADHPDNLYEQWLEWDNLNNQEKDALIKAVLGQTIPLLPRT